MHQTSKYASIMHQAKCTVKVAYKIQVILPESDICCLKNDCQIRWTSA